MRMFTMMEPCVAGKSIDLDKRLIFALDVPSVEEAKEWVMKLENHIRFYKVGLQLFLAGWFHIVDWIVKRDLEVMLDLKFYDVPQTVASAVAQLEGRGVSLTTVHGNSAIMNAAAQSKRDVKILAVTVLTSMNASDLEEMGYRSSVQDLVLSRTKNALAYGCDGVVASGLELPMLRQNLGEGFLVVTPGVRPFKGPSDDQKRVVDVTDAFANGADYVVIGRPIRNAVDPVGMITKMKADAISGISRRKIQRE
jgi:orotidine-5'-phosphate decarboxylase